MPIISIEDLKTAFTNGRQPSQIDYYNLIDTLAALPVFNNLSLYSDYKTNAGWMGTAGTHIVGLHTLTRAMYGYSASAKFLYGKLEIQGSGGSTKVGLLNSNSITGRAPLMVESLAKLSNFGIWPLTSTGGDFYCRIENNVATVQIEVWGEFV